MLSVNVLNKNPAIVAPISLFANCFSNSKHVAFLSSNRQGAAETSAGDVSEVVNFCDFVRVLAHFRPVKKKPEKNKMNTREEKLKCEYDILTLRSQSKIESDQAGGKHVFPRPSSLHYKRDLVGPPWCTNDFNYARFQ